MAFTILKNALRGAGITMLDEIKRELKARDKVASGKLIQDTRFEILETPSLISFFGKAPAHYINVDKGRKAGARFPPINKIKAWIKRKGISLPGITLNQATFLFGRSIAKKGIKPTNIYTNAIRNFIKRFDLAKQARPDIMKELKQSFKTT